jgi:PAS domain S-box-containing protein
MKRDKNPSLSEIDERALGHKYTALNADLEASRQQFKSFIEGALTPTLLFNSRGELVMASKSWESLWAIKGAPTDKPYNILDDKQLQNAGIMPLIQQAFEGKVPEGVEIYYDPALSGMAGRPRWISAKAYPLKDDEIVNYVVVVKEDITDQKETKEEVIRYNELLKNFMDSVSEAMVIYDNDLNYVEINEVGRKQINLPREEIIGKNIKEIIPNIEVSIRYKKYLEVIKTGVSYKEEIDNHPLAPGRIMLITAYKVDEGMGITTSDITDAKNALIKERKLQKELEILKDSAMELVELSHDEDIFSMIAERLSDICQGAFVMINMRDLRTSKSVIKGLAGRSKTIQFVNSTIGAKLIGKEFPYSKNEELLKSGKLEKLDMGLHELSGGELSKMVCRTIESTLRVDNIFTAGFTRTGNLYGSAIIITKKNVPSLNKHLIEAYINQISIAIHRYRSEQALLDSEHRFQMTFAMSPDSVNVNQLKDGVYIDVNQGFTEITGYSREEIIGYSSLERNIWANPEDRQFLVKELSEKGYVKNMEAVFNTKNGEQKVGLMSAHIYKKDGEDHIISITRDITDRKEHQEKLEEARARAEESDRLKTAFLANISHEVRTPMNAILGFSDMLLNSNINEKNRNEYISLINKSSHNLLSIINDIIDFSMIETGQFQMFENECSLNGILNDLLATFNQHKQIEGKAHLELVLSKTIDKQFDRIISDEERIKQIMTNLIGNAIKYTEVGKVCFGCELRNGENGSQMLEFFVEDSGIGIHKENHEVIFERFRQLDDSNTRRYGGNGLGLSISKQIANLLEGDIRLISEPGKGSMFYFSIPYSAAQKPEFKKEKQVVEGTYDWTHKSIIVAEDVMSNFYLIQSMLEETAIDVNWAKNGEEVLEILKKNPAFDLILMDVRMPIMNGYEATKEIRKYNTSIPIIALSANALQGDVERSMKQGCNDHISKPVNQSTLLSTMSRFL